MENSQHTKVINLTSVEYSARQFLKSYKKEDFCMFMQYKNEAMRQAPECSAAKLSSGQRLRCPAISPCPLKRLAADLSTP